MDNKEFRKLADKQLADAQVKLVSKSYLIQAIKDKMQGLDKAINYNRWKALAECLVLVEQAKEY